MTKLEFINELGKRLLILAEEERADILTEYSSSIDEKIKHGQTEKEAIADFGDIDYLVSEILKAYKINPEYSKKKEKVAMKDPLRDLFQNGENFITKWAKELSNFTRNMIQQIQSSCEPISFELLFEILIKAIILLIVFAVLRIPFWLITGLGITVLDAMFEPFNHVFIFIWKGFVGILYLLFCVLIAFVTFRSYLKKDTKVVKNEANQPVKDEVLEEKNEVVMVKDEKVKDEKKETPLEEKPKKKKTSSKTGEKKAVKKKVEE